MKKIFSIILGSFLLFSGSAHATGLNSNVKLYLLGQGANNSTTATDSSFSPHTFTASGSAVISTTQKYWTPSSLKFPGGSTDMFTSPDNADWNYGSVSGNANDFGIAMWVYATSVTGGITFLSHVKDADEGNFTWSLFQASGSLIFYDYEAGYKGNFSTSWTPTLNTWYYIETDRSGSTQYFFVDGTQLTTSVSNAWTTVASLTGKLKVGMRDGTSSPMQGYIQGLVYSKGAALHTANYKRPSFPFTAGPDAITGSAF